MDLLKRYLNAVRFWLPAKQQEDIIAELSEDLLSQVEERESALGRDLTKAEWETFLKERGHPLVVANGYLPQHYLIGPVLFPVYVLVLKIAMLCCLIPSIAVWIGMLILAPARASIRPSLWGAIWPALITPIPVTFAFAMVERYQTSWLRLWSPSKLPPVRDTRRISRGASVFELIVNLMFVGWAGQALFAATLLDASGVRIAMTASGRWLLLGVTTIAAAIAVQSTVNMLRPYWTRMRYGVRAATYGSAAIFVALTLTARPFLDIAGKNVDAGVTNIVDTTIASILLGAFVISACQAFMASRHAWKLNHSETSLVGILPTIS